MNDDTSVLAAVAGTLRTMVDGTVRLSIDFSPADRAAVMQLFGEPGSPMAVARLSGESAAAALHKQTIAAGGAVPAYGEFARELRLSSFFRRPEVWRAVGTDADYRAWLRRQSCAYRSGVIGCEGGSEAAHVRRVADGAGTGIKPEYSAIPLCAGHHRIQHSHGEGALGGRQWFDKQRIEYLVQWCWETLKTHLGHESWAEVPPRRLCDWAVEHDVFRFLPEAHRELTSSYGGSA